MPRNVVAQQLTCAARLLPFPLLRRVPGLQDHLDGVDRRRRKRSALISYDDRRCRSISGTNPGCCALTVAMARWAVWTAVDPGYSGLPPMSFARLI